MGPYVALLVLVGTFFFLLGMIAFMLQSVVATQTVGVIHWRIDELHSFSLVRLCWINILFDDILESCLYFIPLGTT